MLKTGYNFFESCENKTSHTHQKYLESRGKEREVRTCEKERNISFWNQQNQQYHLITIKKNWIMFAENVNSSGGWIKIYTHTKDKKYLKIHLKKVGTEI